MAAQLTVAELVARLRADTGDFSRGLARANRDLHHFNRAADGTTMRLSRLGETAEQFGESIGLATAGAAASLVAIGVSYNTLLQRTTAAFKTILGSAEAAQDMIADLREFAFTSPFPRQVFVEATQQLLGFGVAARDIVPTLDAIQDAVAAVGGGANEIRSFVDIFAQIKSFGRANTEQLQRFAFVGIDAFKILAEQTGRSIGEIRKSVTEGTLDADTALSALTEGLKSKFDGAAAGVKDTWVGAVDRIKAAWRDIGSALVAPFIDPEGGGAAIEWANEIADAMRRLEKSAVPKLAEDLRGLVDRFSEAIRTIDFDALRERVSGLAEAFKTLAPVLAAVGLAFAKQGLAMLPIIGDFTRFIPLPGKAAMALIGLVLASEEGRAAVADLATALGELVTAVLPPLVAAAAEVTPAFADLAAVLAGVLAETVQALTPGLTAMATAVAGVAIALAPVLNLLAQFLSLLAENRVVATALATVITSVLVARGLTALVAMAGRAVTAITGMVQSLRLAVAAAREFGLAASVSAGFFGSLAGLAGPIGAIAVGIGAVVTAFGLFNQRSQETTRHVEDLTAALKGAKDAFDELGDLTEVGLDIVKTKAVEGLADRGLVSQFRDLSLSVQGFVDSIMAGGEAIEALDDLVDDDFVHTAAEFRQALSNARIAADPFTASLIDAYEAGRITHDQFVELVNALDGVSDATEESVPKAREFAIANQLLAQGAQEAGDALEREAARIARVAATMGSASAALAGIAGSLFNFDASDLIEVTTESVNKALDPMAVYNDALRQTKSGAAGFKAASREVVDGLQDQIDTLEEHAAAVRESLTATEAWINQTVSGFQAATDPMRAWADAMDEAAEAQRKAADAPSHLGNIPDMTAEAMASISQFEAALRRQVDSLENWQTNLRIIISRGHRTLASELLTMGPQAAGLVSQLAGASAEELANLDALFSRRRAVSGPSMAEQLGLAVGAISTPTAALREQLSTVEDSIGGFRAQIEQHQDAIRAASGSTASAVQADGARVALSAGKFIEAMRGQINEIRTWMRNLRAIAATHPGVAKELAKLGVGAAPLVAEFAVGNIEELNELETLFGEKSALAVDAMSTELGVMETIAREAGIKGYDALAQALGTTPELVRRIFTETGTEAGKALGAMAAILGQHGSAIGQVVADALGAKVDDVRAVIETYKSIFAPFLESLGLTVGALVSLGFLSPKAVDPALLQMFPNASRDATPRHMGGHLSPGWFVVGEAGPELMHLGPDGTGFMYPNHHPMTQEQLGGGQTEGGTSVTVIAQTNADPWDIGREVAWQVRR